MKKITNIIYPAFALFAFGCFAFLPQMHAAPNAYGGPPPDGCFPEFTTAEGCNALANLTTGAGNTGLGWYSLYFAASSSFSTGVGAGALALNGGDSNTAVGAAALLLNGTGTQNTAVGTDAMLNNNNGSNNTALGAFALSNSTGDYNTALGAGAGTEPGIGGNNIYIGDPGFAGDTNVISIGGIAASGTPYTDAFIGAVYDTVVTDRSVYIAADGHLGTLASSRRYKDEIKPMDKASEALFALQPVTFRYKQQIDPSNKLSFGLIAEDVAKISPDLISRDREGKPQTVRYDAVNAMLLNEFLKEHKTVQEQGATIARLEKQIDALTAGLQRVTAQLELNKSAPQTVLNNQ
jgi:hypothetical protein